MGWFTKHKDQGLIEVYGVVYKGGLAEYPKSKVGKIELKLYEDRFELLPTIGSKKWFRGLVIPHSKIFELQIVGRQVGTFESLVGGLDSRQLNQENNLHIHHEKDSGENAILRLEMLSGLTVMGQAKKCQELEDRLRWNGIKEKFISASDEATQGSKIDDIPGQIEKLASLRDRKIISQDEFDAKKKDLLSKM